MPVFLETFLSIVFRCSFRLNFSSNITPRNFNELTLFRSSRSEVIFKKRVLRNFTKFTGKHLCQKLFFNKFEGLMPATLLKKRLWHMCFPINFVKFLRTPFLHRTPLVATAVCLFLFYLRIKLRVSEVDHPYFSVSKNIYFVFPSFSGNLLVLNQSQTFFSSKLTTRKNYFAC